jgi:hypothetical protein
MTNELNRTCEETNDDQPGFVTAKSVAQLNREVAVNPVKDNERNHV